VLAPGTCPGGGVLGPIKDGGVRHQLEIRTLRDRPSREKNRVKKIACPQIKGSKRWTNLKKRGLKIQCVKRIELL